MQCLQTMFQQKHWYLEKFNLAKIANNRNENKQLSYTYLLEIENLNSLAKF